MNIRNRSIRKNGFTKDNVSRNIDRIGLKIKNFVTFNAMRIAKEHTFSSPRCKLVPKVR